MSYFSTHSFPSSITGRLRGVQFPARGFTLIELMIAVMVIAILTAVAVPSYHNHIRKAKRVECEGVLLNAASTLERRKSGTFTYVLKNDDGSPASGQFPEKQNTMYCPAETGTAAAGTRSYTVTFLALPTTTTFSLQAVPMGGQLKDKCGTLGLNQLGAKTASGGTAQECW